MNLTQKAIHTIDELFEMAISNYNEMYELWNELKISSKQSVKNSNFRTGYIFGKMEHKFIDWFYAEFGRSQTSSEYKEFWNIVKKKIDKLPMN